MSSAVKNQKTEIHFLVQSSNYVVVAQWFALKYAANTVHVHKPRVIRVRKLQVNHQVACVPAS